MAARAGEPLPGHSPPTYYPNEKGVIMSPERLQIENIVAVTLTVELVNGERRVLVCSDIRRAIISPISTIDGYDHADVIMTIGDFFLATPTFDT